jgi:hypothetical protein
MTFERALNAPSGRDVLVALVLAEHVHHDLAEHSATVRSLMPLAQLARARSGRLGTLDRGLTQTAADVADLILR